MIQLDILRGIHSNLHHASEEINTLLGFQMLANLITNVVILIMFGFYTIAGALDGKRRRRKMFRLKYFLCREVLLAVPGDHAQPGPQVDVGRTLGPDHEGHGEREGECVVGRNSYHF